MTEMRTTQRLRPKVLARGNDPVATLVVEAVDASRSRRRERAARRMVTKRLGSITNRCCSARRMTCLHFLIT
jgi:hypothetical protein